MVLRTLLCLLLLTGCSGLSPPEPEGPLTGERLVEALRDGGFVLYLRHAATEQGAPDGTLADPCSAQRGLTEAGRRDAREIGQALDRLRIPIGRVLTSPFCRTADTAELAFGEVERDDALLPEADARELVATEPDDETNTVLVGHISNIRTSTGAEPEEGGTVVFRPDGAGGFRVVAEVPPQGWQRLASRYS